MAADHGDLGSLVFPGSPAIDADAIEHLRLLEDEDEPNVVGELIDLFLRNTPTRLATMRAAVATGNLTALSRAAHSLKSSAMHLGAIGMRQVCENLEAMDNPSRSGPGGLDEAAHLVDLLQREFAVVSKVLVRIAEDD